MSYTGSVPDTEPATDWRKQAACRKEHPDLFFPTGTTGPWAFIIEQAKAVCRHCPVTEQCLQWALKSGQDSGIWGGLTEDERRTLTRGSSRSISIDDYTGIPATRVPATARTLQQHWNDGTQPDGEHLLWVGKKTVHQPDGAVTPNRLAFYLDRGRWPEGDVKRTCGVGRCVRPAHFTDRRERAEEKDLAVTG
jgi:hypothetical protein